MSYFFDEIRKYIENLSDENNVQCEEASDYNLSDNQSGIDFAKEIRIDVHFFIMFKTDDVDKLISLESVFTEQISKGIKLSDITDESTLQEATLSVDLEQISRGKIGDEEYYCAIPAVCKNIVLQKRIENPIKVELDNKTQIQLMKHLSILNLAYNIMEEHREEIQQQIAEMFNFQSICTGILSCSDDSFIKCYRIMVDKSCDIPEATKLFYTEKENARKRAEEEKRRIERKKEEEEKQRAEKEKIDKHYRSIYSMRGDLEMNRHTDFIVKEIQSRMGGIQVYGGSNMSEFLLAKYEKRLNFPCVFIRDDANFTFAYNSYYNKTTSNNTVLRYFTKNDYPMEYSAVIFLFDSDKNNLKKFYELFQSLFDKETVIHIPSLSFDDEHFDFNFVLPSPNKEMKTNSLEHNGNTVYYFEIACAKQPIIYHTYEITENIAYNQRLQFRMLQRMEYAMLVEIMLSNECLKQFNGAYSSLFKKETKTFFLLDKAFDALDKIITSREYKEVKDCILNNKPINREVFNTAFNRITKVYPELYDKTIQGWSLDTIRNDINEKAKDYKDEWIKLYRMLAAQYPQLEKAFGFNESSQSFSSQDSINYFLDYMHKRFDVLLDDTCKAYYQYLAEKAEEERREAEARRLAREEEYYDDYSGGYSNGPSILKTAFGVALGNKMSGNSGRDRNAPQRKDYSNSASCTRKIRVKNGRILEKTCHGCTMAPYCTRYR